MGDGMMSSMGGFGGGGGMGGDQEKAMCSAHGRMRTLGNLMDDGMGGMCCTPMNQCQNTGGPNDKRGSGQPMMNGDWLCPSCGDHQFSRNASCRKCGAAKPDNV